MRSPHSALALGTGVAVSLLASSLSSVGGRSIGAVSDAQRIDLTPKSEAFGIWGLIYPLLIASAVYAGFQDVMLTPAVLLAVAEVLSGIWVPLFLVDTPAALVAAAAVLVAASSAAIAAVFHLSPMTRSTPWTRIICVHLSYGIAAGWFLTASVLSVGIALQRYGVSLPRAWTLLLLSFTAASLSLASRNPFLALPCAWALLWQPEQSVASAVGLVACLVAAICTAVFRI